MFAALAMAAVFFQTAPAAQPVQTAPAPSAQTSRSDTDIFTLRVTTREVLLDIIALDARGRPIPDLAPRDLQVTALPGEAVAEKRKRRHHHDAAAEAEVEPIASLRVVDPEGTQTAGGEGEAGFRIAASCLERSTLHYQMAFHPGPEGSRSGYHEVRVETTRKDVHLHYPHRYYIGVMEAPATPPLTKASAIDKLLQQAACYYPETPPSIALRARMIATGSSEVLRYSVAVDAGSLSFLTLAGGTAAREPMSVDRRVQLDYQRAGTGRKDLPRRGPAYDPRAVLPGGGGFGGAGTVGERAGGERVEDFRFGGFCAAAGEGGGMTGGIGLVIRWLVVWESEMGGRRGSGPWVSWGWTRRARTILRCTWWDLRTEAHHTLH